MSSDDQVESSSPKRKMALYDAYKALAADMEEWILYDRSEDLDEWLDKNSPSKISRSDNIGWISIPYEKIWEYECNFEGLRKDWSELQSSSHPITVRSIGDIGRKNNDLVGKWLCFVSTAEVDAVWRKVAVALIKGPLKKVARSAKVSPLDPQCPDHVVLVYNEDFLNEAQIFEMESTIREMGLEMVFYYKPDVYTHLGIYRNNEYNINPTLYKSQYDIREGKSKITACRNWRKLEIGPFPEMSSDDRAIAFDPKRKTALDYAYEALAAKMDEWILYDRSEDLDEWLDKNSPSKISRSNNIGWIAIECEQKWEEDCNYDDLQKDWSELRSSGEPVNFDSIKELGTRNKALRGQWLFFIQTGCKVEILWRKLAKEFVNGGVLKELAVRIKVSPFDPLQGDKCRHVVIVENRNFVNESEIYALDEALRNAGVKTQLLYKPSVYTLLGIYRNNEFGLKPTVYTSVYDALKKKSKVTFMPHVATSDLEADMEKVSINETLRRDYEPVQIVNQM